MKLSKQAVLEVLSDLEDNIQNMREEGETDLRSVLQYIYRTQSEIRKMEE